jgi:GMP synthase (glutamine-hydrolysing) B subunit
MDMFVGKLHAKVMRVDASEQFLGHLAGVSDPEAKRKIIGREFVEVFKAAALTLVAQGATNNIATGEKKVKGATFLAQGTIYPDVIESGGAGNKKAVTIKSHHNVGGLPEQLGLKLLEPLRELFKDEVRELGVALAWVCAFWVKLKRNTPTCCAVRTPSSSRSCVTLQMRRLARPGTTSPARPSLSFCRSKALA